mmetsp:Transcript_21548/g.42321  ORF Transcript_21548/g.42321 Transcript_21548/m.42321 type:complete len:288 (+) Transcript_21548:1423-2286(+)
MVLIQVRLHVAQSLASLRVLHLFVFNVSKLALSFCTESFGIFVIRRSRAIIHSIVLLARPLGVASLTLASNLANSFLKVRLIHLLQRAIRVLVLFTLEASALTITEDVHVAKTASHRLQKVHRAEQSTRAAPWVCVPLCTLFLLTLVELFCGSNRCFVCEFRSGSGFSSFTSFAVLLEFLCAIHVATNGTANVGTNKALVPALLHVLYDLIKLLVGELVQKWFVGTLEKLVPVTVIHAHKFGSAIITDQNCATAYSTDAIFTDIFGETFAVKALADHNSSFGFLQGS